MKYDLTVAGGAWNRKLYYTENGSYSELHMPGGGALLARMLEECGKSVAPTGIDDTYAFEYLEIARDKESGNYYLDHAAGWKAGKCESAVERARAMVIYDACPDSEKALALPLPKGTPMLLLCSQKLPDRANVVNVGENVFLCVDVEVLRRAGGLISKQISWERTATDLLWQLLYNPTFSYLMYANHILITFAEDALVYIRREGGEISARLALSHGGAEGFLRDKCGCAMPDTWMAMAAGTALQFEAVLKGKEVLRFAPILDAAHQQLSMGYDTAAIAEGRFAAAVRSDAEENAVHISDIPIPLGEHTADPNFWCISDGFQNTKIYSLAFATVKRGLSCLKGLPHLSFGALTTVDRREIEAFQNIRNLITEYANGKSAKPLSIAVFGSPGSGKSFGVTQIAQNVLPGVVKKLEFNVSQFRSSEDLAAAFHSVRDVVLSGKLPLVFFDEFDSDRDGQLLGWLKSFLMPMQDGKFKDVSGEHPIGKCIMVFAGGTSSTFEDFTEPLRTVDSHVALAFKNVKGPDFVSRLRGSINILGPNPAYKGDKNYMLRRAILLRSLCERKLKPKGEDFIDDNVLKAMLILKSYKHGARSMEAILDMSRLEGGTLSPATLPFYSQLSLHVDADAFLRLVLQDVTINSYVEKLAHAIHDEFVQTNPSNSSAIPWEELHPDLQESNRRQARSIGIKLNAAGFAYDEGDTPFETVEAFTPEDKLFLSIMEHNLWLDERLQNGWVYGPKKDNNKKTNPNIIPWEKLKSEVQQYDIDVTENIIPLLRSIGMRVYRTV